MGKKSFTKAKAMNAKDLKQWMNQRTVQSGEHAGAFPCWSWEANEGAFFEALEGGLKLISALVDHAEDGIEDEERYIISNFCNVMRNRLDLIKDMDLEHQPILYTKREHFTEMCAAAKLAAVEVDKKYRPEVYR